MKSSVKRHTKPENKFLPSVPVDLKNIFVEKFGFTKEEIRKLLNLALSKGGEFSELFFEYRVINSVHMEEDIIKESSESIDMGAGVRVIQGIRTGYAYTSDLTFGQIRGAVLSAAAIASSGHRCRAFRLTDHNPAHQVYDMEMPVYNLPILKKIEIVEKAYASAKDYHPSIHQIQVHWTDEMQWISVFNSEGLSVSDIRPQVRLTAVSTARSGQNVNTGTASGGGRRGLSYFADTLSPEEIGRRASEEAVLLLSATDPSPGEQPVVLGSHQSGVMIHEAVGHPLEADGNWKKTSIMWNRLGKKIASPLVTIFDDPSIPGLRGSLNIDDEGTQTQKTVLIEKGKLVSYLHDRLSSKILNCAPTGHGRRQSFHDIPQPRMCNTVMARGEADPESIIRSVKRGFYAYTYQGGQVLDSGKFTFSVNLGYSIENGRLSRPVKNATLIGTNIQILKNVEMVGNDMGFFLGTCGKGGQSSQVTAGIPTIKIKNMVVGGRR